MAPKRKRETLEASRSMMSHQEAQDLEKKLIEQLDLKELYTYLEGAAKTLKGDEKERLRLEYIRFIVLKVYTRDFEATKLSPPALVDFLWNFHLQESISYKEMCEKICKTEFIHHRLTGSTDGGRTLRLAYTRGVYDALWPTDEDRWKWANEHLPKGQDITLTSNSTIRATSLDDKIEIEGQESPWRSWKSISTGCPWKKTQRLGLPICQTSRHFTWPTPTDGSNSRFADGDD